MALESIADVRVFVQVVDSAGLSAASRVLGVPPNTVSRTIARLEHALGARLLTRTTRTMSLTDEGRVFYERAASVLDAARRAEEAVAGSGADLSGAVRIAVRTTTVQFSFIPDLLELLDRHPELRVQLIVTDDEVDLVANGLDLALRVGEQSDSTLRSRSLGAVTFVMAALPSYLTRRGRPEHPRDLETHDCIRPLVGRATTHWTLLGPRGKRETVQVSGRFECSDVRTQRDAIYAGFGIGLRPAGEVERARELERVLPHWVLEPIAVRVLQPPLRPSPRRARAVDAVIELLSKAVRRMAPS
jgi:DNA-binding transcriptional LysR family regulator